MNSPFIIFNFTTAQSTPTLEFDVPPHGTYLRADDKADYGPETGPAVAPPLIVDLAANGLSGGLSIVISFNGTLYAAAYWDGTLGTMTESTTTGDLGMYAVFSTTIDLLPITQLNRVPGAIQTELTLVTPNAWFSNSTTDIPQDFRLEPYTGMDIEIPLNAKYLFICVGDVYYPDNAGAIKVMIDRDSDRDGLPNSWETNGIDLDKDGVVDLNLPALGADWEHKDIFIEVDYMGSDGSHMHRPNQDALNDVIAAFANSPVENPDGEYGVNLHIFVDELIPHAQTTSWDTFQQIKSSNFGTLSERTNPKNVEAKKNVFHYCLFAHSQPGTTSGGLGEYFGNDFLITLGGWTNSEGDRNEQAATFMHELGHNLGLDHGGGDDVNYKPNYISVMNYLFQTDRYNTGRALDYSWGGRFSLNEAKLNETLGIGSLEETVWRSSNGTLCTNSVEVQAGYFDVDWNFDGNYTANDFVQVNLNNHPSLDYNSAVDENLTDYNDWLHLAYNFRSMLGFASGEGLDMHEEITVELDNLMKAEALTLDNSPTPSPAPLSTPTATASSTASTSAATEPEASPTPSSTQPTPIPSLTASPSPEPITTQTPTDMSMMIFGVIGAAVTIGVIGALVLFQKKKLMK